jgi:catechol 2,3-dioxygenase-like lactoylglutathione lyase family enzyme
MFERIDHLVVAVPDPDAAAADLLGALGLAATGGGRHASGTWNRLVFLGDTYLELIGVWDAARAAAHPIGRAALAKLAGAGAGLATYALATAPGALVTTAAALQAAGSPIGPPIAGHRDRPDGVRVTWTTAIPPDLGPDRPPFLIEHEPTGPEWGPAARAERARAVHPFGGTARLIGIEMAVAAPVRVAGEYASTLGITFSAAADAMPGAREARVRDQQIRLVAEAADAVVPACRVGILADAGARELVDLFGIRFARL